MPIAPTTLEQKFSNLSTEESNMIKSEEPVAPSAALVSPTKSVSEGADESFLSDSSSQASAEEVAPVPDSGQRVDPARHALLDSFQDLNELQALMRLERKGKGQGNQYGSGYGKGSGGNWWSGGGYGGWSGSWWLV